MSASELLLLLLGRGIGGADANCDWEIARAMNQSRPTRRCTFGGAGRVDDARVAAGLAGLAEEEAGRVMMGGDMDDDDSVEGSRVAPGLWWRVESLWDGACDCSSCPCCSGLGVASCRLRDLYQLATSTCGRVVRSA